MIYFSVKNIKLNYYADIKKILAYFYQLLICKKLVGIFRQKNPWNSQIAFVCLDKLIMTTCSNYRYHIGNKENSDVDRFYTEK